MQSLFITSPDIKSARWLSAFAQAIVIKGDEYCADKVNTDWIVWLLLEDNWRQHLESSLAHGAKVVAMSLREDVQQAQAVISAGACGYVHAFAAPEMLVQVHKVVASGGAWLGAALLQQLVSRVGGSTISNNSILTEREQAVAKCVAVGKSNKEAAKELEITERTVKAHLSACFKKLNIRDRVQLALVMNK